MVVAVALDLVVQTLVEPSEFFDAVADAVVEVLVAFGLLVTVAVYLKEGFVIGLNNVDFEVVALGTLGVVGPPAAFVGAGDRQPDHVPAYQAQPRVLPRTVDVMHPLHPPPRLVVAALRVEHEARYVDELPRLALALLPAHPEPEVGLSLADF